MTRLPVFAERHFAAQVSEYDALCHRVDEDESGWDYVVELPNREHDGPAESQPPSERAFVQVKSIQGADMSVDITLSNMLKSAQDPSPWFIVLIKKDHGKPVLYIKHFWKDLIERSLKAVRKADGEGAKLNKRRLTVTFNDEDIIPGNFIAWMRDRIAASDDYLVEKRNLYANLGYENGHGQARMLFSDHTDDEIYTEFLGLGNGLRLSKFEYLPERFSLPDYSRQVSRTSGKVYITPQPSGSCEVRFRTSPTEPAFRLTGDLYSVPFAEDSPIRVSAPPVELLFRPGKVDLNMSIRLGEAMPLEHWYTYSQLKVWSLNGPLQVEVWKDNRKLDAAVLLDRETSTSLDWPTIHSLSTAIKAIADERSISDLSFTLADINAHIDDLGYLFQGRAPSIRFQCEADMPLEPGVTSFVHYSFAELAGWTFGHLLRRTVLFDVVEGNTRFITAGPFRLVETYAFRGAGEAEKELMRTDYERLLHALEESEHPLGFGEFGAYVRELQKLNCSES